MDLRTTRLETRKVLNGRLTVEIMDCWIEFNDPNRVALTPSRDKCPRNQGPNIEIEQVAAVDLRADREKITRVYAKPPDEEALRQCMDAAAKMTGGFHISCGYPPDQGVFKAFLVCNGTYFKISVHDPSAKFPQQIVISPDELPDEPYKAAFKSLRCKR